MFFSQLEPETLFSIFLNSINVDQYGSSTDAKFQDSDLILTFNRPLVNVSFDINSNTKRLVKSFFQANVLGSATQIRT